MRRPSIILGSQAQSAGIYLTRSGPTRLQALAQYRIAGPFFGELAAASTRLYDNPEWAGADLLRDRLARQQARAVGRAAGSVAGEAAEAAAAPLHHDGVVGRHRARGLAGEHGAAGVVGLAPGARRAAGRVGPRRRDAGLCGLPAVAHSARPCAGHTHCELTAQQSALGAASASEVTPRPWRAALRVGPCGWDAGLRGLPAFAVLAQAVSLRES